MRIRQLFALIALTAVLLFTQSSFGQTSQGRISGRVTDTSGGVVGKATVTIENLGTQVKRVLETNSAGDYVAPGIEAGFYSITVEAAGFKKVIRERIQVEVTNEVKIDFEMSPGGITEVVQVTDEAPLTETTNAVLNGVISNKAINELPLQGRDFQNLLALHPGVQRTPGGGFHSTSSNGNRVDANNYIIDGANDNDVYYGETVIGEAGISGAPASHLPLDAIQEFNTQQSPQADFGAKPGVVVNIGLKSGTNDIHGTAYYFHRNSAFDARNYFNQIIPDDPAASELSALLLHQFGASIGGPIIKNKWFYFANYEGVRAKVGNPGFSFSPATVSNGDPFTSKVDAENEAGCNLQPLPETCNALSLQVAKLFLPNPGTANPDDPTAINFNFNNQTREDNLIVKSDYHPNDHNTISARFVYANTNQIEEDGEFIRPEWLSAAKPVSQVFGASWAWVPNSRWANEARFSYNRFYEKIAPSDSNVNPTAYGINTGITDPRLFGFPRINPDPSEFDSMGGSDGWPLWTTPSHTEEYSDTVSYTSGRHTMRFGGDFRHGGVNYLRATSGRGFVGFDGLPDFYAGIVDNWELQYGDPERSISMKSFGLFVQDDFRIRPRVTINLGLRYDVTYPIKDKRNLLANYVPTMGIVQAGMGINQLYATNHNNFSPRIGVAWDVFGKGKTVLRAGGGVIFAEPSIRTFLFSGGGLNLNPSGVAGVTPGNGTINTFLRTVTGSEGINWNLDGPVFDLSPAANSCSPDLPCDVFGVAQNLHTPYVVNWTASLQQALTPSLMLQVAYVANRGVKLYSNRDINQPDPALTIGCFDPDSSDNVACQQAARPLTTNCPAPVGLGTGGPCFPFISFLNFLGNDSSSIYHALQVTVTKRYSKGLYLLAGYTYGHAIDTATSNGANAPPNSADYAADRGNSDFDIRHRLTASLTYDLPSKKMKGQLLEGWQIATIVTAEGGEPITFRDTSDDISATGEFNDRWNIVGNPAAFKPLHPGQEYNYFFPGSDNPACAATATTPELQFSLDFNGCYQMGNTLLVPPAFGTFGNMGRNIFRGPKFVNWDSSVSKSWKINERLKLQLRGEFFNVLNHPNFDVFTMRRNLFSNSSLGVVRFTPDVGESNPVIGSGGSRHIQLGAKLIW